MTVQSALDQAIAQLELSGIGTARLDCLVLLEDITSQTRAWLLAHPDNELEANQAKQLQKLISRRAQHEPLSYIRAKTEFYGREFVVDKRVLEPRPESETMIDLIKSLASSQKNSYAGHQKANPDHLNIIDIGTGSGALAITAALELPGTNAYATDIDSGCLEVAKHNARKHHVSIQFFKADLVSSLPAEIFGSSVVLANLPYVPDNYKINRAATQEPRQAIFGGPDGLDVYRRLFEQINQLATKPGYVLTESLPSQHEKLNKIAQTDGFKHTTTDDFIQVFTNLS